MKGSISTFIRNDREITRVMIEDTKFYTGGDWTLNLGGDPDRSGKYRSNQRTADIVIDEEFARELEDIGVKTKMYLNEKREDAVPVWYVRVKLNFDFWEKPNVYFKAAKARKYTKLDEDTISNIDDCGARGIENVKLVAHAVPHKDDDGRTLWVQVLYADQADIDDPWYQPDDEDQYDDEIPFR